MFIILTVVIFIQSKFANGCLPTQTVEETKTVASPCIVCPDIFTPNCNPPNGLCSITYEVGPVPYSYSADADSCSSFVVCPHGERYVLRQVPSQANILGIEDEELIIQCQQTTGASPGSWFANGYQVDALTCQ